MPRFLNRILGLSIPEQGAVFDYFSSLLDATVAEARSRGAFDRGVRSLGNARSVAVAEERVVHVERATGVRLARWLEEGMDRWMGGWIRWGGRRGKGKKGAEDNSRPTDPLLLSSTMRRLLHVTNAPSKTTPPSKQKAPRRASCA